MKEKSSIEFQTIIDEKRILKIPNSYKEIFNGKSTVIVKILSVKLSKSLVEKNVTEEEIEKIAKTQYEEKYNVEKFLLSDGSLSNNKSFFKRAQKLFK